MGNPVARWQILSKSPDTHARFYASLFDWNVNADNALGYRMIETNAKDGIDGGFWPSPPEAKSMVSLYVAVDDVARYVDRAKSLGATVVIPPQKLPDGDEMAVMVDPEGIAFGIFKSKS
jgi:predicted enzyme related to lactoylglutathione lyase